MPRLHLRRRRLAGDERRRDPQRPVRSLAAGGRADALDGGMKRLRAVALALLAPVTLLLAYVVWGKSRRKPVLFNVPDGDLTSLLRSFAAFTWGHVSEGNRVDIVQNSGFFDALLRDVAEARHHVHLETFLWANSQISDRIEV